jgi:hypothetical protein
MIALYDSTEGISAMADQIHKAPIWHQMHYDPTVEGVWSGFGSDLNPLCGQSEQIVVTSVTEAVDCQKCVHGVEQLSN